VTLAKRAIGENLNLWRNDIMSEDDYKLGDILEFEYVAAEIKSSCHGCYFRLDRISICDNCGNGIFKIKKHLDKAE